jgi:hypothetical protein
VAEAVGRLGSRKDCEDLRDRVQRERSPSAKLGLWHGAYLLGASDGLAGLFSLLNRRNLAIRSAVAVALQDTARRPADARESVLRIRQALRHERTVARDSLRSPVKLLTTIVR